MRTIEELREYFSGDRFAAGMGIEIDEIGEGYAQCSAVIRDDFLNARGNVMGGATFTIADYAFAVAAATIQGAISIDISMTFLGAARGTKLIARASCVKHGKRICGYRVDVTDDLGTIVASGSVTGFCG